MQSLLDGYKRFRTHIWPEQKRLFETLAADGQKPKALVIACIDSRVEPARIFDASPGELLTVRNVANLVPPCSPDGAPHGTSAALEFGIKVLGIPNIVVLGHGQCGGVRALLEGTPPQAPDFIAPWMSIASGARRLALQCDAPDERQQCCEYEVIKTSLANLRTYPWINQRVEAGQLRLHGAWFSIATGKLMRLDAGGTFAAVD